MKIIFILLLIFCFSAQAQLFLEETKNCPATDLSYTVNMEGMTSIHCITSGTVVLMGHLMKADLPNEGDYSRALSSLYMVRSMNKTISFVTVQDKVKRIIF